MIWTPKAIADLKRYAAAGCTYTEIGKKLGCSRGAAAGKCVRLGVHLTKTSAKMARPGPWPGLRPFGAWRD
jgi:hypothetical protein